MFSIVMPVWNKRPYLAATVASALAQSWRDFELIVVDDGSTDGGMAALARFDDPRIRCLAQPNRGPGAARNTGMGAARHDWIAFLDADDLWMPDHLAELDRVRASFPDAGLIASSFLCTDLKGGYRMPHRPPGRIEAVDYFDRVGAGEAPFGTSSAAIPKSSFARLGGFCDAPIGQDVEYWVRIALERPIAVSSRITTVYQLGTGGIGDTLRSACLGRELRHAADIGPHMALVAEHYPKIRCPRRRRALDRYIDRQFQYCVRTSARIGDCRTLRAMPRLYPRAVQPADRLILAIARLPPALAIAAFRLGAGLKAAGRALRRRPRLRLPRLREPGSVPAGDRLGRAGG